MGDRQVKEIDLLSFTAATRMLSAIDPLPPLRYNVGGWSKVRFNWNNRVSFLVESAENLQFLKQVEEQLWRTWGLWLL